MSSSFWLGSSSAGMRSYDVDAHYEDGFVWLGNNSWNSELNADARYKDGCVWLGSSSVGNRSYDVIARYEDGYIWLGNNSWNSELNAIARYKDGCMWLGASDTGHRSYDTFARYDGPDDGAAATLVLLLLLKIKAESTSCESSSDQEVSDSESCEEDEDTSNSHESVFEVPYDEQPVLERRLERRNEAPQEESQFGLFVIMVIILLCAMAVHYISPMLNN